MIRKEKQEALQEEMQRLEIFEEDLTEKFILGSGKGGQKVNKAHTCVYLKHLPTQLEVKCQKSRSRDENRYFARKELCEKVKEMQEGEVSKKRQEIEKIRRQKRKRSKRAKEKMLLEKKHRSAIKSMRESPQENESI